MTNPAFDAAFSRLLRARKDHEALRAARADIPALSRSSHELYQARMAMHHLGAR